jgi:hypothetical protein
LILALLPLLVLKKYNLALRTLPVLFNTMDSMLGEATGKVLSTPTPSEIFLTVNVAVLACPWRLITSPLKLWILSLFPSMIYGDIVTCFEGGMV